MIAAQLVITGLLLGGTYLLMAVGLNLIFGVMRVVNFAHGSIMVFSGLLVYWLATSEHLNTLLAVIVASLAMFLAGALIQLFAIERVRAKGYQAELLSLLVTYGVALVFTNVADAKFGSSYVSLPAVQGAWVMGPLIVSKAEVLGGGVGLACSVAALGWLRYTQSGKRVLAASQSREGAQVCGINSAVVGRYAFAVGSALAGLAGALLIFQSAIAPDDSLGFTVIAFVLIAVGGLGNYLGSFVSAAVVGLAVTIAGYLWGGIIASLVPYMLLMAVMLVRFRGARGVA